MFSPSGCFCGALLSSTITARACGAVPLDVEADPREKGDGSMTERSVGTGPVGGAGILVVIPALNEEASIQRVVHEVQAAGYPALVVDDGSVDRTAEVAQRAG